MKQNGLQRIYIIAIVCVLFSFGLLLKTEVGEAATKQYGILVADKQGNYTFYDLNLGAENQSIEIKSGKVMVPLRKVCSYLAGLNYAFDFKTRKATILNESTGKRLVLTENSKYAYLYEKGATTAKKVKLSEKCYVSSDSNAFMVHRETLKWILKKTTGYQYYGASKISDAGYDSGLYQGIMVYNPYTAVNGLSVPTKVNYVPEAIASNIVKVTIPEGFSVAEIVERLVEKGVCIASTAVFQAMEEVDMSQYSMFDGRVVDENICFPLEGYLFPDTYEFYKNSSPKDVLAKILGHSNKKLGEYASDAKEMGYELDELIRIASIIEKEASTDIDRAKVSSVLHARLLKGMQLQCDATINYVEEDIKPYITGDINRFNIYYNTYKCDALPAGPISNPGENAIEAALNPSEVVYLYFSSDKAGVYYYATNDEEFLKMREAIRIADEEYAKKQAEETTETEAD